MKDFQDEDFKIPIFKGIEVLPKGMFKIREMTHIHNMADLIINSSYKPKEFIKQIVKDDLGREVAYLTLYFNVPLASIPDITRLQRDFLIYSKGEITKVKASDSKEKQYEFSNVKTTIGDIYRKAGIIIPSAEVKKVG